MLDERSASEAELDPGQKLKRTHNTSFGAAMEDHGNDTDDSGRGGENSSPEGWAVKVTSSATP